MPIKPVKRFTAWSYSRLGDYIQCPLKAKLKHLDKVAEPPAPALERGSEIHAVAAKYAKGELAKFPDELQLFEKEFGFLKKNRTKYKYMLEEQWAFNRLWESCSWFDRTAWCRMILDLAYIKGSTLIIIDHKTGKIREEQKPQLTLYALGGLLMFPQIKHVSAQFWYLDQGVVVEDRYKRTPSIMDELRNGWSAKVVALLSDTKFAPRPGDKCRWCYYRAAGDVRLCKF